MRIAVTSENLMAEQKTDNHLSGNDLWYRILGGLCCNSILDPMLPTFYITIVVNSVVLITCIFLWVVLFMNISLQFFAAAESAYHKKSDYSLHTVVTLSLLPTMLLFWTFIVWCIVSRLIELVGLIWTTPYFTCAQRYSLLHEDHSDILSPQEIKEIVSKPTEHGRNDIEAARHNVEVTRQNACDARSAAVHKVAKGYVDTLVLAQEAEAANKDLNELTTKANRYRVLAIEAETHALKTNKRFRRLHRPILPEESELLPQVEVVQDMVRQTSKIAAHARESSTPRFSCTWSEYFLDSPFENGVDVRCSRVAITAAIFVEVLILALLSKAGLVPFFNAVLIMVVFTAVLVMLWAILDAASDCSRAFWYQWCICAGCAVLSALLCFVQNDWQMQFLTTNVIVYISVYFAITGLYVMHQVWLCPIHDLWKNNSTLRSYYFPGIGLFWIGISAFIVAFFLYVANNDQNGAYFRVLFQLCWTISAALIVCKTSVYPHYTTTTSRTSTSNQLPRENTVENMNCTRNELSIIAASTSHSTDSVTAAYGTLVRGDWNYYFRLIAIGYFCMLFGVFGGSWASGNDGVLSVLCYIGGPLVLAISTVIGLYLLSHCGTEHLAKFGWSYPAVKTGLYERDIFVGVSRTILYLFSRKTIVLWAWDVFRFYSLCVLIALLIVSIYSKLISILLFLIMVLFQGYALIEYLFFSPVYHSINIGGVRVAKLHNPKKRMYVMVLLLLFFCDVIVVGVATWSLTTSYDQDDNLAQVRSSDMEVPSTVAKYGMCYEQTFYTLDVIDLAYMTELTYFHSAVNATEDCGMENPLNLKICLDHYFVSNYTKPGMNGHPYNWQVLNISIPTDTSDSNQAAYYGVRSAAAQLIVVGARGSTTGKDWLEDFNLYSETSLLQFFSLVIPITYIWPYQATSTIVQALSFSQKFLYANRQSRIDSSHYFKPVQDYAEALQVSYPDYDIMLIGHSLGGATAQIAAARMGVRGFGFEPPGTLYSEKKFGIPGGSKTLDDTLITVMRENDPVVYVDEHGGEIQQIMCESTFLDAYCHSIHPITCHFMANCGAQDRITFDYWGGGNAYCGKAEI